MGNRDYNIQQNGNANSSSEDSGGTNRQYKDRLFKVIFGYPERRHLSLQVYNELNGTSYEDSPDFKVMTIDNVVYMGMRNDVSFLLDQEMNLWEQQSTPNPNMPLRFLLYYAHVMERHVKTQDPSKGDIYSSALMQLPTLRMVLFYNGPGQMPEHLYLSDAFADGTDPDVQARVRVININSGQDRILEACKPLRDYTTFVEAFRRYQEMDGISDRDAASRAIAELEEGDVREYLEAHQAEVIDMLLTEYDEEKTLRAERYAGERVGLERGLEQGRQEGLERGLEQGRQEGLRNIIESVAAGELPLAYGVKVAVKYGVTDEADFRRCADEMGKQLPE